VAPLAYQDLQERLDHQVSPVLGVQREEPVLLERQGPRVLWVMEVSVDPRVPSGLLGQWVLKDSRDLSVLPVHSEIPEPRDHKETLVHRGLLGFKVAEVSKGIRDHLVGLEELDLQEQLERQVSGER